MPESPLPNARFAGRYEHYEKYLAAFVELRADGSFDYEAKGLGPPVEGEGRLSIVARGIWRIDRTGSMMLSNAPTAPARFERTSAMRDPSVHFALTVTGAGKDVTDDLSITVDDEGEDQDYTHVFENDRWTHPLFTDHMLADGRGVNRVHNRQLARIAVRRGGDDRLLAVFTPTAGAPNRFVYAYTPSPIPVFNLAAAIRPGREELLEIAFGSASLTLQKVGSGKTRR